jgi:hypothetical protein
MELTLVGDGSTFGSTVTLFPATIFVFLEMSTSSLEVSRIGKIC